MSALIYIAGFLIGAAVFMYLYSLYQSGAEKLRSSSSPNLGPTETQKISPQQEPVETRNFLRAPGRAPGERLCPLCGSSLTRYEPLYASKNIMGGEAKILIHGCRYCYKPDDTADYPRRSSY